jgi:hypothetical protein
MVDSGEKVYSTRNFGLAAFLLYCLSEDRFIGPKHVGKGLQFLFRDIDSERSCGYLAGLFWSRDGAQCSNAFELLECSRLVRQWPLIQEGPQ